MDGDHLADRLVRVRRRIETNVPYSPDWAAAIEELEELEAALDAERAPVPTQDAPARPQLDATAA